MAKLNTAQKARLSKCTTLLKCKGRDEPKWLPLKSINGRQGAVAEVEAYAKTQIWLAGSAVRFRRA
ncbi:hypothetical protein OK016_00570 [Vibrio chagasii]|nr:hypothetical protein [Vibrio chagasii]